MNIYVASSWRCARQPEVVKALRSAGHEVYDFRNPPESTGFAWSQFAPWWENLSPTDARRIIEHPIAIRAFNTDMKALEECDACVLVMPCGKSAHLELGWAANDGKYCVVLLEEENEPELMYLMAGSENVVGSVHDVLLRLDAMEDFRDQDR